MPDKHEPLADNPHGENFRTLKDDGRRFAVRHTAVGAHRQGAVVSAMDLGPGAELPRLVRLGAISELSPSEVRDHESAAAGEPAAVPVPVIQPTGTGPVVKPDAAKGGK